MVYCVNCGEQIDENAIVCIHCGVQQPDRPGIVAQPAPSYPAKTGKDRITSAVLAILLGSFGAHKFYLGQSGLGIIYFLFSWTTIPFFLGIIEGIGYLSMSKATFAAKYSDEARARKSKRRGGAVPEDRKGRGKSCLRFAAIVLLLGFVSCVVISLIVGSAETNEDRTATAESGTIMVELETITPAPTATDYPKAWVTGVDMCPDSDEYGQVVLPSGINVWKDWGDNRSRVAGQANHAQEVEVLEVRQDDSMEDDRIYYKIRTSDGLVGWLSEWYVQFRPPSQGFDPINDCWSRG